MAQQDKTRKWSMIALIAFNITVILCMIGYVLGRGGLGGLYFMDFVVAIVLATFVACGAFIVAMMLDK
jgi:cytosine/uracil/thiamine/allantoin permease